MERNELGAFEWCVLAVGGLVALPVLGLWMAAGLAAALAGHHLDASFEEALSAAGGLKVHLTDPAAAWPAPAAEALPGPLLYWGCTAFVFGLVALAGVLVLRWWAWSGVGTARRAPLGVDARPRFATAADLRALLVARPVRGRFVLGRLGRRLIATETPAPRDAAPSATRKQGRGADRGSVALIGPTRSGKTVAAISGILEWEGPAVLSSVKSDLLGATLGWRSRQGEVRVYDPTGVTGQPCASWSPLRAARTYQGALRTAALLCDGTAQDGVEYASFWFNQAEILLSSLAFVAANTGREMGDVRGWVMTQDRPGEHGPGEVRRALDALLASEDDRLAAGAADAATALLGIWQMEDRTRSSVYATAQSVVWPWADPGVARAAHGVNTDLDWLLSGNNTLYLCAPIEDRERLAPAFGGLLNDLIRQAMRRFAITDQPIDPPLLVVVDEAANTPLKELPQYTSTLAGMGVLLVTVWQALGQIEAIYGRKADGIIGNHRSKVFYGGVSDPATLRYVASVLGEAEVDTRSSSVATVGRQNTWQVATTRVPMAPPHALREMQVGDALLVHGNLRPVHLRTRPYFLERGLRAKAEVPPEPVTPAVVPRSGPGGSLGSPGPEEAA